jgi:ankyrin repeat protein
LLLDRGADCNHATTVSDHARNNLPTLPVHIISDVSSHLTSCYIFLLTILFIPTLYQLGTTALLIAVKYGYGAIVKLLLERGADVNQPTIVSNTSREHAMY